MPYPGRNYDRLAGEVAIVTGGGSIDDGDLVGTGSGIATAFAAEGAAVAIVDYDRERGERTQRRIQAAGGSALYVQADVTREADCNRVVDETLAAFGRVSIVVNNAGGGVGTAISKLDQLDHERWQALVDLNLTSVFLMSKAAIGALLANDHPAIVNIASVAGLHALGALAYGAAKAGMVSLTRDLALSYGRDGLRANVIAPGHIFTPLVSGLYNDDHYRVRRAVAPLGIEGNGWDIAAAAVFLASREARFITGQCLAVDGGVTEVGPIAAVGLVQAAR